MQVDYDDITSRIKEAPSWYTTNGVPRYGKFNPGEANSIYAAFSILYKIECQSCHRPFLIGVDYDQYDLYLYQVDTTILDKYGDGDQWVPLCYTHFTPLMMDSEGHPIVKTLTIKEVIDGWGYGDPPRHDCIGDTMSSIERETVEMWDRHYGRIIEKQTSSNGNEYNTIKFYGELTRVSEFEGIDLTPDWAAQD